LRSAAAAGSAGSRQAPLLLYGEQVLSLTVFPLLLLRSRCAIRAQVRNSAAPTCASRSRLPVLGHVAFDESRVLWPFWHLRTAPFRTKRLACGSQGWGDLAVEPSSSDHHASIIDVSEMKLYELYEARRNSDGSWSAALGAVWDLTGYAFRKNGQVPMWSVNEAGLPHFVGLVRYDEVSAGVIPHALLMAVPHMADEWRWPARSSAPIPSGYQVSDGYPPAGQRFRLKASFDISGFLPQAKVILQALKTYGMAVATNNPGPPGAGIVGGFVTIIGSPDSRWNLNTDLSKLRDVPLDAFEAVDVRSWVVDPPPNTSTDPKWKVWYENSPASARAKQN
jgi:hypothetical protein